VPDFECAPVVLLGYHRPEFTQQVFAQIRNAKPAILFLVMDGPQPGSAKDAEQVRLTREIFEKIDWECDIHKVYAPENVGLKARVTSGLDYVFSRVEEAIILEDDCLPSPDFFRFSTELLERFRSDNRIGIISGASRLRGRVISEHSYDFSKDIRIWGWATWARTWREFSASGDLNTAWSPEQVTQLSKQFPAGSRRRHMKSMLASAAKLDSWALPFAIHCRQKEYLNPVSCSNLVRNIGFGPSSTHTKFESYVKDVPWQPLAFPLDHPESVRLNPLFDETESRGDRRELFVYPLRHPFDVARRLFSYLGVRLGALPSAKKH